MGISVEKDTDSVDKITCGCTLLIIFSVLTSGLDISIGQYGCPDLTQAKKATIIYGFLWPYTIIGVLSWGTAE